MNWIVSGKVLLSTTDLDKRREFIQEITGAEVTRWREQICRNSSVFNFPVKFYQCCSKKGEYGFFITAHMNSEVQPILRCVLNKKKALVVINSCALRDKEKKECMQVVKLKNPQSELFFAKQTLNSRGYAVNYLDDVGTFGFETTKSERELFQKRECGFEKTIRSTFERVETKL